MSLIVTSIFPVKTIRGKENLVTCKIEEGIVNTNHPAGQNTYYLLENSKGESFSALMTEAYHKTQLVKGEKGTYISFYFPMNGPFVPEIGDMLLVKI